MAITIGASVVLAWAGYLWLVRWCGERALQRRSFHWCLMSSVLAGGVAATSWQPGQWGCVILVCACPLLMALVVVDGAEHRLPDVLTRSLAMMTASGLVVAALVGADGHRLWRAGLGALILGSGYFLLALLGGGGGMGLGDVKLAPSLGALMAWSGWNVWASGAMLTFVLGGLWGVVLLLRGAGAKARMPFGPFMIGGAVIALITA